jgi:carboxypeptidase C (cathepsin A)
LQQDQGLVASGIVMLSPLIDGPLLFGASRTPLGAAFRLPSLAAAELDKRNAYSKEAVAAAEQFALGDYLSGLAKAPPSGAAAEAFYDKIAKLSGLPIESVRNSHGAVHDEFVKRLREADHAVVSQYDAAFAAPDPFPETPSDKGGDPILDGFVRAYGGAFASYARNELGFKTEMTYTLLAGEINGKWDWGRSRAQVSGSDDLRQLLSVNPSFRVLVAHGASDLVTPYSVSKYLVDHLPDTLRSRVAFKLYRGGHMLYTRKESRLAFSADAKAFYAGR